MENEEEQKRHEEQGYGITEILGIYSHYCQYYFILGVIVGFFEYLDKKDEPLWVIILCPLLYGVGVMLAWGFSLIIMSCFDLKLTSTKMRNTSAISVLVIATVILVYSYFK